MNLTNVLRDKSQNFLIVPYIDRKLSRSE